MIIYDFIKLNIIFLIGLLIIIIIITKYTKTNFILGLITIIITTFIGYYVHYISHNKYFIKFINNIKLPLFIKNTINYHHYIHHDNTKKELKYKYYEFFNNLLTQGILLLLLKFILYYLNGWVILINALCYSTIHIINFEIIKPKTHKLHHKYNNCNYGYEIYDIIFNTKKGKLENMNHYLINFIIITFIILLFYKYFFKKKI
jgi:hypothetical protein